MDFREACNILDIKPPFSLCDLKKSYYRAALIHHPDRNQGDDLSNIKFQRIGEAYTLLGKYLEFEADDFETSQDYDSIIKRFVQNVMGFDRSEQADMFKNVIAGCRKITLETFKGLDKHSAVKIFKYIERYSSLLGINAALLDSMRNIIREKMRNDTFITLNPDISNVFNQEVYVLQHNENIFYVPLWHDEVCYDVSGSSLIVRCVPDIPKHMSIDQNNDVHIHVSTSMNAILSKKNMNVKLGEEVFEIPVCDLKIRKYQIYTFKKQGIPRINIDDAFNTKNKGNIVVHLELIK
jgi:hypothetical protein